MWCGFCVNLAKENTLLGKPVRMLYGTDICLNYWICDINRV